MTTLENIQSAAAQIVGGTLSVSQQGLLSLLCGAAARELELRLRPGVTPEDCGDSFVAAAALSATALFRAAQDGEISGFDAGGVSVTLRSDAGPIAQMAQKLLAPWCDGGTAFLGVRA